MPKTRFTTPCRAVITRTRRVVDLREISHPNAALKRLGWVGLVAHIQTRNGSTILPLKDLEPSQSFIPYRPLQRFSDQELIAEIQHRNLPVPECNARGGA